jgi:hypothetical protein
MQADFMMLLWIDQRSGSRRSAERITTRLRPDAALRLRVAVTGLRPSGLGRVLLIHSKVAQPCISRPDGPTIQGGKPCSLF